MLMKFSNTFKKKEYSITSDIKVDAVLLAQLDLKPSEPLFLENTPEGDGVVVKAKGDHVLGTIVDRELSYKVKLGLARALVLYVMGTTVKVELSYS
jgi:hypothetical protein